MVFLQLRLVNRKYPMAGKGNYAGCKLLRRRWYKQIRVQIRTWSIGAGDEKGWVYKPSLIDPVWAVERHQWDFKRLVKVGHPWKVTRASLVSQGRVPRLFWRGKKRCRGNEMRRMLRLLGFAAVTRSRIQRPNLAKLPRRP